MPEKYSFREIAGEIADTAGAEKILSGQAVLGHMIGELPEEPWADINITAWLSVDDKLPVDYCFADTRFGRVLAANTPKGLCYLGLSGGGDDDSLLSDFSKRFCHTLRTERHSPLQKQAFDFLEGKHGGRIMLHLRGTPYQTEIWRRLVRIPYGRVIPYSTLGGEAQYARAAGTANGRNPVFWIVPCHRAVRSDGGFDRYFWGEEAKKRLLAWEFANSGDRARTGFRYPG